VRIKQVCQNRRRIDKSQFFEGCAINMIEISDSFDKDLRIACSAGHLQVSQMNSRPNAASPPPLGELVPNLNNS